MDSITIGALGVLFSAIVAGIVSLITTRSKAKVTEVELLRKSYNDLQTTYMTENTRLHGELGDLRKENVELVKKQAADKSECQGLIAALQQQVIVLTAKLPNAGELVSVKLAAIDTQAIPALPVIITTPLPIPMTAALAAAALAAAALAADKENKS